MNLQINKAREAVAAMGQCTFCSHSLFLILLDKQFVLDSEEQTMFSDRVLTIPMACTKCAQVKDNLGLAWGHYTWTVCFNVDLRSLAENGLNLDLDKSTRGFTFTAPMLVDSILRTGMARRKETLGEIQRLLKPNEN
jgi:hypothetical protein